MQRGLGITVCPEVAVKEELAGGGLTKLNWQSQAEEVPVLMIWHAEKWCSPLLKQFMVMATEVISD